MKTNFAVFLILIGMNRLLYEPFLQSNEIKNISFFGQTSGIIVIETHFTRSYVICDFVNLSQFTFSGHQMGRYSAIIIPGIDCV